MKKNKSVTLAIGLSFLIVSLFVSLKLMEVSQEMRRQASEVGGEIYLTPVDLEFKKGETKQYELRIKDLDRVFDGIQMDNNICYDSTLIEFISATKSSIVTDVVNRSITGTTEKCLNLAVIIEKEVAGLPKGNGELLVTLNFKALSKTGNGNLSIYKEKEKLIMAGPEGKFYLSKATGAKYTVIDGSGGGGDKKYKRTSACDKSIGEFACAEDSEGSFTTLESCKTDSTCFVTWGHTATACNTETGDWNCTKDSSSSMTESECKMDAGCDVVGDKYKKGECNTSTGKYACTKDSSGTFGGLTECEEADGCEIGIKYKRTSCDTSVGKYNCVRDDARGSYTSLDSCQMGDSGCVKVPVATNTPTPPPVATNTPTPPPVATNTPVPPSGDGYALKFKMIYPGLAVGSATDICMRDLMKVQLTVLAVLDSGATETVVINDVSLSRESDTVTREDLGNKSVVYVFRGKTILPSSFKHNSKLALFISSKKHLPIKYGVDKQTGMYKEMYGKLGTLTKDIATTPEFDFTAYPPLAGDINNDGVINLLDFSELKAAMNSTDSKYYGADLNGDCVINAFDSTYFFASLKYKEGQIY
jgi:hypothetical protein